MGLKQIGVSDRYRVDTYLEEVKRSEAQLKDIEKEMGKLLEAVPYAKNTLSIPVREFYLDNHIEDTSRAYHFGDMLKV